MPLLKWLIYPASDSVVHICTGLFITRGWTWSQKSPALGEDSSCCHLDLGQTFGFFRESRACVKPNFTALIPFSFSFLVLVSLALVGLFLSFHWISLFDLCSCISYDCTLTALTDHLQVKGSVTNDLQGLVIQYWLIAVILLGSRLRGAFLWQAMI